MIAIVLGCLIGVAIIYVIDRHLSNISINLPKIVIPQPDGTRESRSSSKAPIREDFSVEEQELINPMSLSQ